jgi:hypothetical protein
VALHLILAGLVFEPTLFSGADAGHYMVLGESLGGGLGYRDHFLPGSPLHAKYPPGYPLLLAVLGWIGGLQLFKAGSMALTAASVWLTFRLGRRRLGDAQALLGAALLAVSPVLLDFSHLVLSEALFGFLVLLSLAAARPGEGRLWLPLLAAAMAFLTRTAGLALLLALAAHFLLTRDVRRIAIGGTVALLCLAGWAAYQRLAAPMQPGYVQQLVLTNPYDPGAGTVGLAGILGRAAQNFWTYASREFPASFGLAAPRGRPTPAMTVLLGLTVTTLASAGWLRAAARRVTPAVLFTFFYIGLILLWPSVWSDRRLLLPVLPLLILYVIEAGWMVGNWRLPGGGTATAGAVALALAIPAVASTAAVVPERLRCQAGYRDDAPCNAPELAGFYAMAAWAAENTPPEAIIANRSPATFYLFSRRKGNLYRYSSDPETVLRGLEDMGADYVVVDQLSVTTLLYLVPTIEAYPDRFEPLFAAGDPPSLILRVITPPRTALRREGRP